MRKRPFLPSLIARSGNDNTVLRSLHHEIDRIFDNFNLGFDFPTSIGRSRSLDIGLSPRIDVAESNGAIEITAELPGVAEKDVKLTITEDVLTIKGEKKSETQEDEKDFHVVERSYGAFRRSVALPYRVDPDQVEAKFGDGVLRIVLPKPPEAHAKRQKIEIKPAA